LRNSAQEISLMERCDWSVGQCLQISNEASTMCVLYGFRKFISNVKGTLGLVGSGLGLDAGLSGKEVAR